MANIVALMLPNLSSSVIRSIPLIKFFSESKPIVAPISVAGMTPGIAPTYFLNSSKNIKKCQNKNYLIFVGLTD